MGSAPSPKAGGGAGEVAARVVSRLGWCRRTGSDSKGEVACQPRLREEWTIRLGQPPQIVIFLGLIKSGSLLCLPRPRGITVCKMGQNGQNRTAVWPLLHPSRHDVSFSFAKLLVSCKAYPRPRALKDGRVERRVLTGGSAEGRRARRAWSGLPGVCARVCARVSLHAPRAQCCTGREKNGR